MMNGDWQGYGWGWWVLMSAGMIAFWGVVLWLIVGFVRGDSNRRPDAESILADRFARGEIDDDEYRQRLDVLRHRPSDRAA